MFDYSVLKIILKKNSYLLYINICLINIKALNVSNVSYFFKKIIYFFYYLKNWYIFIYYNYNSYIYI